MNALKTNAVLQNGKYRIEGVLGQGGFGITYLASQVALNRKVTIKEFFMKELCNRDEQTSQVSVPSMGSVDTVARFRAKFVKEAQTIAALNNPHIIHIHDIFEENGTAYYVMDYLSGGLLSDLVQRNGVLDEATAIGYIRQVADALSYIHARNINHLDIKPSNVLIDGNGNAVVIDFGLSKRYDETGSQTSTTPVGISHGFAPLEQYQPGGVSTFSPTTDIYSLGATLYKLLSGQTPPNATALLDADLDLPGLFKHLPRHGPDSAVPRRCVVAGRRSERHRDLEPRPFRVEVEDDGVDALCALDQLEVVARHGAVSHLDLVYLHVPPLREDSDRGPDRR